MRILAAVATGLAGLAVSSPAMAGSSETGSARITATVPEVCNISANQFVLNEAGQVTGSVQEFCNSNNGFAIVATHRPLTPTETAQVQYGNLTRVLDSSGLSQVAMRSGQRIETVNVVIDASAIEAPLAVAFTMSAI